MNAESPDYIVRTFHRQLTRLTRPSAHPTASEGYHLIDHTYNLTRDAVRWGLDSIRVITRRSDAGGETAHVIRPRRDAKTDFTAAQPAGDELTFDATTKQVRDYRLQCLPLVPVFESTDWQSDHARAALVGLMTALDNRFPRGHFGQDVQFVLEIGWHWIVSAFVEVGKLAPSVGGNVVPIG